MKKIFAVLLVLLASNVYAEGVVVIPLFEDDDDSNDDQSYGVYDANDTRIGTTYDGSAILVVEGDGNRAGDVYRQGFNRRSVTGGPVYYTSENCTGTAIAVDGADISGGGGYFELAKIGVDPSNGPWPIDTPISRTNLRAFLVKNPDSVGSTINVQSNFNPRALECVNNGISSTLTLELEVVNDVSVYVPPIEVKAD